MPLSVSEADVSKDFDRLMECQFNAFTDPWQYEPYHEVLYPGGNTVAARTAARDRILADLAAEAPRATYLKVTDDETGEIVAGGKWLLVDEQALKNKAPVVADWVTDSEDNKAFTEHILTALYANRGKCTGGEPFFALEMCYVDPKHQKRGAGKKIMEWGMKRAEKLELQVVIESTPFAKHLYEIHGCECVDRIYIEVPEKWLWRTPIKYYLMHKEAPPKTNGVANRATGLLPFV
ncbi:hypothetical protein EDC01DRAFT_217572 [Geopyxis carbonaria]|nr:hypothetical protein EDC01DRAFT_217572 [Geopyxis carbonaria]